MKPIVSVATMPALIKNYLEASASARATTLAVTAWSAVGGTAKTATLERTTSINNVHIDRGTPYVLLT